MKYMIEILRHEEDGTRKVLQKIRSDARSLSIAKAQAMMLLQRAREANGLGITDRRGHEVYSWRMK